MKLKNKLIVSAIISIGVIITSIIIPIIPCGMAPGVPSPVYKYTLCSLNIGSATSLESIIKYYGYTTSLQKTFLITFLITFIVVMILLYFTTNKKKKN